MKLRNIILFGAAVMLASCSCSHDEAEGGTAPVVKPIEVAPRDSSIYEMGRRHAAHIINYHTHPDSIGEKLLEVRARETELRRRVDDAAADAYIYGFERYVSENSPWLADSIL